MRAKELYEDYNQQLDSDLTNLLVGAKGAGVSEIDTSKLAARMQKMGYSVDANSILVALQNNPVVLNASPESVRLNSENGDENGAEQGSEQDTAAQVSDMAQKASDKETSIG